MLLQAMAIENEKLVCRFLAKKLFQFVDSSRKDCLASIAILEERNRVLEKVLRQHSDSEAM